MKKLLLLLIVLLVLTTITVSPSAASTSRPFHIKMQSILAMLYQRVCPFSGVLVAQADIYYTTIDGEDWGYRVGGDADDLANGKWDSVIGSKPNANGCLGDSGVGSSGTYTKGR
jgi:hypothetical protein